MLGMDFGQQQMLLFLSLRKNAFLKEDSKSFACSLISIPKTGVRKCWGFFLFFVLMRENIL